MAILLSLLLNLLHAKHYTNTKSLILMLYNIHTELLDRHINNIYICGIHTLNTFI